MMNKPILSICIPTYNREKYLKKLLDSIVVQEWFSDEVEIFIYDDPSSDNTESMVWEYTKKYSNIHYHRNITRAGMMPSILDSILKCSWEYIWLFGSDDIMWPFGIKTMLSLIKKGNPDLILSNYWKIKNINYINDSIDYTVYGNVSEFCNNLNVDKHKYADVLSIDHLVSYFSYMSIYCFRSDLFKSQYNLLLEKWKGDYLSKHYFNYIYILFHNTRMKTIYLCNNPTLTYHQWWKTSWKISIKILKDVLSIFNVIKQEHNIQAKTNKLFREIFSVWYMWYIDNKIYNFYPVKLLKEKYGWFYGKCVKLYNLIVKSL